MSPSALLRYLRQLEDNYQYNPDDHQINARVEKQRRADLAQRRQFAPNPKSGQKWLPENERKQPARQRRQQPGGDQQVRINSQRSSRSLHVIRERVKRKSGRRHQPADETASRPVVPAQQQIDRKEQHQRHQVTRGCHKNQRIHQFSSRRRSFARRIRSRSNANTPIAATESTVISPRVSNARKS